MSDGRKQKSGIKTARRTILDARQKGRNRKLVEAMASRVDLRGNELAVEARSVKAETMIAHEPRNRTRIADYERWRGVRTESTLHALASRPRFDGIVPKVSQRNKRWAPCTSYTLDDAFRCPSRTTSSIFSTLGQKCTEHGA
ncbi:hypothetical protein KM043_008990 [Ampulex compressa]|nr:hypothetical protein KM043_008990 [Ampulex compressa]